MRNLLSEGALEDANWIITKVNDGSNDKILTHPNIQMEPIRFQRINRLWIGYTPLHVTNLEPINTLTTIGASNSDLDIDSSVHCIFPTAEDLHANTLNTEEYQDSTYGFSLAAYMHNNSSSKNDTTCDASTWINFSPAVTAFLMVHLLLSHMSYRVLYDALKRGTLLGFPHSLSEIHLTDLPACEIDRLTKSHVKPRSGLTRWRPNTPGAMWHSDLKGPFKVKSIRGFYYWMTFIDDFSGYCYLYFLKIKSDALIFGLKRFVAEVLHPFGITNCVLIHDPGGEYSSHEFQKYCYDNGIQPNPIPAKNPHYNGIAENKNKILAAGLRSSRLYAKLPAYLWCCITETVNDMLNITPRASAKYATAYYNWHGVHPSISNLHVIGAECYLHDPNYSSSSQSNPSEIVRFLGYVHHSKSTHRLWRQATGKLLESNHVTFITTPLKLVSPYDVKYIGTDDTISDDSIEFATVYDKNEFESRLKNAHENESRSILSDVQSSTYDMRRRSALQAEMASHRSTDHIDKRTRRELGDARGQPPSLSTHGSGSASKAALAPEKLTVEQFAALPLAIRRERRVINRPARLLLNMLAFCYAVYEPSVMRFTPDHLPEELDNVDICYALFDEPTSFAEAQRSPDYAQWKEAMDEELSTLTANGTWQIVDVPPGTNLLRTKWVFKKKLDKDRGISRYRARLVCKGYTQTHGVDYNAIFSPVVRHSTLRIVLAIAAHYAMFTRHLFSER